MIGGSLSIDSLFAGNWDSRLISPKPFMTECPQILPWDKQYGTDGPAKFPSIPEHDAYTPQATDTERTYNTPPTAHDRHANNQFQDVRPPRSERTTTETDEQPDNTGKPQKKDLPDTAAEQPSKVQLWLAQYSLNLKHGRQGTATKVLPKAGRQLAQLLAELRANSHPSDAEKTTKILPNKQPANAAQSQTASEALLSGVSKTPVAAIPLPNQNKTTPPSGKTATTAGILTSQQTQKQSTPHTLPDAKGKPAAENTTLHQATQSFPGRQASPRGERDSIPDTLVNPQPKATAPDAKSAASTGQKVPGLDSSLSASQQKPPQASSQPVPAEKSAEPAQDRTDARLAQGKMIRELSGENAKESRPAPNSLASASLRNRPGTPDSHTSSGQTGPNSQSGSGPDFAPTAPNANTQPAMPELFSDTFTQPAKAANSMMPRPGLPDVGQQILESIHNSLRQGEQQITIRLNPPELGRVFVRLQEHQQQITGLLEVTRMQTRYEIEHELPNMIRTLHEAGIQIRRLEVVVSDQPEQEPFRDQSLLQGSFRQNDFNYTGDPAGQSADEWLMGDYGLADSTEPQILTAEGSINMLV